MAQLHLVLAIGTALGGAVVVILGAIGWARRGVSKVTLDRAILVVEGLALGAILTGGISFALRGFVGPADPLHLLYAALILATLPIARFAGSLTDRRRALAITLGGVLVVAFFVRLLQTG